MDSRRQEDEWCEFFEACLTKRISAERFSILWPAFRKNHDQLPLQGVAAALLNAARINGSFVDPRLPVFMNELLYSGTISLSSFLSAALPTPPRDGSQLDQSMLETAGIYKPSLPATVIQLLTAVVSDRLIGSTTELAATLKVLARWLDLFHSSAALGYFISAILATNLAQTTLVGIKTKGPRR